MKLSEAIRLGAMSLRDGDGTVFHYGVDGQICGACALGCAGWAVGITKAIMAAAMGTDCAFTRRFPLSAVVMPDPMHQTTTPNPVAYWITTLYECRGWTREQIADWVATLEAAQEAVAVDPHVEGASLTPVHAREKEIEVLR